jgi:hypothetical protein
MWKIRQNNYNHLLITFYVMFLVIIGFLLQGHLGINMWDEGWLWHGTQNVMKGEIPIRDFSSYDPGRYYWSAIFFWLTGENGIIPLRIGIAVIQFLGLLTGAILISKIEGIGRLESIIFSCIAILVLFFWMFPRHKTFDITLSIFLVFVLYKLLKNPSVTNYFTTGLFVGVAAVFGRNHGVYSLVASLGAIIWLSINLPLNKDFLKRILSWASGILLGFIPIISLILFAPGFGIAFYNDVKSIIDAGTSNPLVLPIPWPWTIEFADRPILDIARAFLVGLCFFSLITSGILLILWLFFNKIFKNKVEYLVAASIFPILPYAHHAYSRADVGHLSQGIFPLLFVLITSIGLIKNYSLRTSLILIFLFITIFTTKNNFEIFTLYKNPDNYTKYQIGADSIIIDKGTAKVIEAFKRVKSSIVKDENSYYSVLPYMPGFYALYNQKAPLPTLSLYPKSKEKQLQDIEKIKKTNPVFFFIWNGPLDGIEARRYSNTHNLVYQYILENTQKVDEPGLEGYELFISNAQFN